MKGVDRLGMAVPEWADLHAQHQLISQVCNRLEALIRAGQEDAGLAAWLQEQWALFAVHFAFEERLMAQNDYPGLQDHRRDHDVVFERLRAFDDACGRHIPGTAADVLQFIHDWDAEHQAGHDRKLEEFLRRR